MRPVQIVTDRTRAETVHLGMTVAQRNESRGDVIGTIRFSHTNINTPIGTISLGFSGGKIWFEADDCRICRNTLPTALDPLINTPYERTTTETRGDQQEASRKSAAKAGVSMPSGGAAEASAENQDRRQGSYTRSDSYKHQSNPFGSQPIGNGDLVLSIGGPEKGPPLVGRVYDERLFSLLFETMPCKVTATFEALPQHVHFLGATDIWSKDLSSEKQQLIRRLLCKLVDEGRWPLEVLTIEDDRAEEIEP